MTARGDRLPLSLPPRGLNREESAAYVGVSPSSFDKLVAGNIMPRPKAVPGFARRIWDRIMLDQAFAALPEETVDGETETQPNEWDEVFHG